MGFGPFFVCMTEIAAKIESVAAGLGYELVDVQASNGGRLLRVFIDKPAGSNSGITVDDCAVVSRQLTRVLPVEGVEFERLEVSSPGLDRPLRKADDFARFAGQKAEVRMRTPDETGRRKFAGVLRGVVDGAVSLELDGKTVALALADVDRAKLIPEL
jgi:ribosome maturation factor RimP